MSTDPMTSAVPGTWPDGEPEAVRVAFDAAKLTPEQLDGTACVLCGAEHTEHNGPSIPVGVASGGQVFACSMCVDPVDTPAAATVPGAWPGGEPEAVRAAADAPTVPTVPTWLQGRGCPSWCEWSDNHREHDHYDDRTHTGAFRTVILTAVDDRRVDLDDEPDAVRASLYQHYREIGPRVELSRDERPADIQLTLDEAEELARKLIELVAIGRAE